MGYDDNTRICTLKTCSGRPRYMQISRENVPAFAVSGTFQFVPDRWHEAVCKHSPGSLTAQSLDVVLLISLRLHETNVNRP